MKMKLLACTLLLVAIMVQSCDNNSLPEPTPPANDSCPDEISYESDVKPIITNSCAISGCHNGDNGANVNWTVFANLQSKRLSVKDRINRAQGTSGHMPAVGSLSAEQIATISCWVDQGGQNN